MISPREISIHRAHPGLQLDRIVLAQVKRVIWLLDARAQDFLNGCPPGEVSLVFLSDPALAKLHGDFLADPTTTDVITFEGDAALGSAGEVCVSVDTALAYARRHRRDFAEELTLYLVHGWLHLAGYDDLVPAKKRRMRAAEKRALTLLRGAKAIPTFSVRRAHSS